MEPYLGGALIDFFENHEHRIINKWMHYFEIYERHFEAFRDLPTHVLEFGVMHGGSLQMWKHYFGPQAQIVGVDINPRCAELAEENITILTGDQEDREFLRSVGQSQAPFDIIIDDGGHTMAQQTVTFEEMWGHLKPGGIYLCEDLHTSYWSAYGGGYKKPDSFIEYSKNWIDQLNAWHSPSESLMVNGFTRSAFSVHYYNSIVVLEKRIMRAPYERMKGVPSFPLTPKEQELYDRG